ncbi:MAG: D-Ala-D-Ala carboxypeptidase family metallohydrolase [Myxococcota bacterium]
MSNFRAPPREIWIQVLPELQAFFTRLFRIPIPHGTLVTSWYRDQAVNAAVGGVPTSFHLWGLALDVSTPEPAFLIDEARFQGLEAFDSGTHVHIEPLGRPPVFRGPSSGLAA